jgi:hypothetical protein
MSMELVAAIAVAVLALLIALIDMAVTHRDGARDVVTETMSLPAEEQRT